MKMPINEQFIPGQWIDTIDVNDFVNLNRKPFLKEPFFLAEAPTALSSDRFGKVKKAHSDYKREIDLAFPSLDSEVAPWLQYDFSVNPFKRKIGYSENFSDMKTHYGIPTDASRKESRKTAYQLFNEVVTSEISKMIKMDLFHNVPSTYSPLFIHPDVRIIALYGTKHLIKEKRWGLKTLEKHLQTHEWMQRRISIHREIDSIKLFEKFAQKHGTDVSNPAVNAEQAIQYTTLAITATMLENPSVPFSLVEIIPFLDIFIESDISSKVINEQEAQELIDDLYFKLSFINFSLSPGMEKQHESTPIFFGETFGGENITKTTYRFFQSLKTFYLSPFAIRILWNEQLPTPFINYVQKLADTGLPISFYAINTYLRKDALSFFPNGLYGVPGEDVTLDAGGCDLEKLFYLSLNGGKDTINNINLTPITQPVRKEVLDFDEVLNKFKDYLSYTLSSYVELMNIVLYLSEVHNNHPFRSSLMSHLLFYHIQFGFTNLEKAVTLLTAVYENDYQVHRDSKGWVTDMKVTSDLYQYEGMLAQVIEMIQSEINKLPIYKSGKPKIKLYFESIASQFTSNEAETKKIIPADMTNVIFHINLSVDQAENINESVKKQMKKGFREVHLSFRDNTDLINGILYKRTE